MKTVQSQIALLSALMMVAPILTPIARAQQSVQGDEAHIDLGPRHWYTPFAHKYTQGVVRPIDLGNSNRLESLLRAGNLYLSLRDAVALALENNVDIEVQRYA